MTRELTNLEQLLDRIGTVDADDTDRVSLGMILQAVGTRSFGPLLLLLGLLMFSPLSGIPTMPTTFGMLVLLTAIQMLFHKEHIWLPRFLLKRSVSKDKLDIVLTWLQSPARFIDRLSHPRLTFLIQGYSIRLIAVVCLLIAASVPLMELVPFLATGAGAVFAVLGLALVTKDGLIVLFGFVLTALGVFIVIQNLV